MLDEIQIHEQHQHWKLMHRKDIPLGAKTIMAIWSFKRKCYPDGRLNEYKARSCAYGGMQTWRVNYCKSYASMVTWISVGFVRIIEEI